MEEFSTSLLREKFIIKDKHAKPDTQSGKVIEVKSNRIAFTLGKGNNKENVVIRAKRAYLSMIVASRLLRDYFIEDKDPLLKRVLPVEWDAIWQSSLSEYEKEYNANIWVAVYVNGNPLFKYQEPEFVDIIE